MKKDLVVKSNKLINQSYKLSANELKVLYLLITKINKEDEDFKLYSLKISEFVNLSGLEGVDKHSTEKGLPKVTRGLLKKGFSVIDEKGNLLQVNWLSSAYHRKFEGIIELEFSPRLKPYLLQLKEKFTMFSIENVIKLKSAYSMRIYELIKQYEAFAERTININEFKTILSINDLKAYQEYSNIKIKILEVARTELKEQSDIYFEYTEIKEGRKVVKIKFLIYKRENQINSNSFSLGKDKKNKTPKPNQVSLDVSFLIEQFQTKYNAFLDENLFMELINLKGFDFVRQSIFDYEQHTKTRTIFNIAGDFYTFVKHGYKDVVSKNCDSIHNFNEREYKEEDLNKFYANLNDD